jgi:hypothetical protein
LARLLKSGLPSAAAIRTSPRSPGQDEADTVDHPHMWRSPSFLVRGGPAGGGVVATDAAALDELEQSLARTLTATTT